jgi:uncharacterized membrane protein
MHLKHGRHFDYGNQPLNIHMPICYLDCHEAGMCCYLVIHLVHPLQLFQTFLLILPHISFKFYVKRQKVRVKISLLQAMEVHRVARS